MPTKETAAQRKSRYAMLLEDYANRNEELRKLTKIVDGLKEQIKEVPPGKYADWELSEGTPREITDQAAVKARFAALGELLPTKLSAAPKIVKPVVK